MKPLITLARQLAAGDMTSVALTEQCLERIADQHGEGARAFIHVYADAARAAAQASDTLRAHGLVPSPLAGIPISVKDLFDIQGDTTRAGSVILRDAAPAHVDAPAIARLRAAGAIVIGRTNMTEFAYGAHGMNSHYGTPRNPWDRATGRIPGGSTSGGAVSVTDGMASATIGSDTGGSVRIPAALCGLAGFKPTQARVPLAGAFPLSATRDSIGPLGVSAACCIRLDAVMAHEEWPTSFEPPPLRGLRLGVPKTLVLDDLMPPVADAFARALTALSRQGAVIEEFDFQVLADEAAGSKKANFSSVEAYALHRDWLATRAEEYDPYVYKRLVNGANMSAADYYDLIRLRQRLIVEANRVTARYDALLAPTVPIIAPTIAEMEADEKVFFRINSLLLRNCAPFNVLDRPCWSLPCHRPGDAPVGLMVIGETMQDRRLQRLGLAIEAALSSAQYGFDV
ncbi:MAG: amidase [Betaproteobacteria bacterium]|nr:amidase [Betaproteobacteria bacterium]